MLIIEYIQKLEVWIFLRLPLGEGDFRSEVMEEEEELVVEEARLFVIIVEKFTTSCMTTRT